MLEDSLRALETLFCCVSHLKRRTPMKPSAAALTVLTLFAVFAGPLLAQEPKQAQEGAKVGAGLGAAVAADGAAMETVTEGAIIEDVEREDGPVPVEPADDVRVRNVQLLVDGNMVAMDETFGSPAYFEGVQDALAEFDQLLGAKVPVELTASEDNVHRKQVGRRAKALQQLSDFVKGHMDPNAPNARAMAMLDATTRASMVGMQLQAIQQATQYEEFELKKLIEDLAESEGKAFMSDEEAKFEKAWREALGFEETGP